MTPVWHHCCCGKCQNRVQIAHINSLMQATQNQELSTGTASLNRMTVITDGVSYAKRAEPKKRVNEGVRPEWRLIKGPIFGGFVFIRRLCDSCCGGVFLGRTVAVLSTTGRVWAAA